MNETSSKNEITSGIIWKQLLLFFFIRSIFFFPQ